MAGISPTTIADGSSQAGRRWPALDPLSAPVDGRSALDLLAFVQALSRELRYTEADGLNVGKSAGDWRALLPESSQIGRAHV